MRLDESAPALHRRRFDIGPLPRRRRLSGWRFGDRPAVGASTTRLGTAIRRSRSATRQSAAAIGFGTGCDFRLERSARGTGVASSCGSATAFGDRLRPSRRLRRHSARCGLLRPARQRARCWRLDDFGAFRQRDFGDRLPASRNIGSGTAHRRFNAIGAAAMRAPASALGFAACGSAIGVGGWARLRRSVLDGATSASGSGATSAAGSH